MEYLKQFNFLQTRISGIIFLKLFKCVQMNE